MTEFILTRVQLDPDVTIGELTIAGHHVAFTCEDQERDGPKVPGKTAIPRGRYRIERTFSPRFGHDMLQLMDVPGFQGIRIHAGNDADDTEGCILPGLERRPDGVGESKLAVIEVNKWFDAIIAKGQEAWITVRGLE